MPTYSSVADICSPEEHGEMDSFERAKVSNMESATFIR